MLIAAITRPVRSRIGAETLATPASRSATLCAQPRRRTSASVRPVNLERGSSGMTASGGSQASRICAAEPAVIGSTEPTGTVSRRPLARSAAATQIRSSARRR